MAMIGLAEGWQRRTVVITDIPLRLSAEWLGSRSPPSRTGAGNQRRPSRGNRPSLPYDLRKLVMRAPVAHIHAPTPSTRLLIIAKRALFHVRSAADRRADTIAFSYGLWASDEAPGG